MKYINKFIVFARTHGIVYAIQHIFRLRVKRYFAIFKKHLIKIIRLLPSAPIMRVNGEIRVSILMPVYNSNKKILTEAIESVINQSYQNWELCICDDCSTNEETQEVLKIYHGTDPRIKITRNAKNMHIAKATNRAAEFATGDFIGFLDHDDTLSPYAIEKVVDAILKDSDVDILYTDEDKIDEHGIYIDPYIKPKWSPQLLHSVMYILHFFVIRKCLFLELEGVREKYTGAQDFDLALRATRIARKIIHIPIILYHWRKIPGSAASEVDAKPQALINAKLALEENVSSIEENAIVMPGLLQGTFRVHWPIPENLEVTLLILTNAQETEVSGRGKISLIANFINSIVSKSSYKHYRILVVDNANIPEDIQDEICMLGATIVSYTNPEKFNFSKKINFAFSHVTTEHVIILNDDLEVISSDWIEALLSFSIQPSIGAVGAKLLYPDYRVQHAGIVFSVKGICKHIFHNLPVDRVGYYGYSHLIRNYSAVTGAVLATRMSLVRELGGFGVQFATDYNDVDFCLRLGELGYQIVFTPYAILHHFEGKTLKRHTQDKEESRMFSERWANTIGSDPFYRSFE